MAIAQRPSGIVDIVSQNGASASTNYTYSASGTSAGTSYTLLNNTFYLAETDQNVTLAGSESLQQVEVVGTSPTYLQGTNEPEGIATDALDNIFVVYDGTKSVLEYAAASNYAGETPQSISAGATLYAPTTIAVWP